MRLKKNLAWSFISYQQNYLMTCLRKQATENKNPIKVIIFLGFLLSKSSHRINKKCGTDYAFVLLKCIFLF